MNEIPNGAVQGLPGSEFGRSFLSTYRKSTREIHKDVLELDEIIEQLFIAMLADGHALLEGEPGVGKTLALVTLSNVVDAKVTRIQFHPETYPKDMYVSLGGLKKVEREGRTVLENVYNPGPLFTQILIGDEINRAPQRVHAPLLEPLQEKQITFDGQVHPVGDFYYFVATQNPVETAESTNQLPAALRERMSLMVHVPYPEEDLLCMIGVHDTRPKNFSQLLKVPDIVRIQNEIYDAYVMKLDMDHPIVRYGARIITTLHDNPLTTWGPGVRAMQHVLRTAGVHAFLKGRSRITFEDIRAMAKPVLRFKFERSIRRSKAWGFYDRGTAGNDQLIDYVLERTPVTADEPDSSFYHSLREAVN